MTGKAHSSDVEILTGFQAEREESVHHVQGWIDGIIHLGRWNFHDPEGVAQEVMIKLLTIVRRGGYRSQSSFKTFVFSVAKFTCVDTYRRERQRPAVEQTAPHVVSTSDDPEAALEQQRRVEMVRYIAQKLPAECRKLWSWVYDEERTAVEVGRLMGLSAGNVRVRVHRCLKKARVIGQEFVDSPQQLWG
jgi:RNA polymerase sigma-70 factor (ECF subfamily)